MLFYNQEELNTVNTKQYSIFKYETNQIKFPRNVM